MNKRTKNLIKVHVCAILSGALILVTVNHYARRIEKKPTEHFKDEFFLPKIEESKIVERYSFDYNGEEIVVEGNTLEIYSYDENGNLVVERGERVEIPIEKSEKESQLYKVLDKKDKIKNQFSILLVFEHMEELYKEYLGNEPSETLENRKEVIYNVCRDYILSDEGYTMGGYKFSELKGAIRKDISNIYKNICYMRSNNNVKEKTKFESFIDNQEKIIKYKILKIGRE